jgi:glycosyltransferase involved in cell wall biosynthesis
MTMCIKHFGLPGHTLGRVIHNGIAPGVVKQLTIPKLVEMRGTYDRIYACSANWHGQKRLAANVALFDHLRTVHPNSCLIVLGNNPDHRATGPHVFYAGAVDEATYMQVYAAADWLLHLAWGDHCSNVCIEALSQGTPVACSEVGGTKELVGGYGAILKDTPFNFELYDYDDPPTIDVTQVADLPTRQALDYSTIADIDIGHVATKYVELFEQVLCTPTT